MPQSTPPSPSYRDPARLRWGLFLAGLGIRVFVLPVLLAGVASRGDSRRAIQVDRGIDRHRPMLRRGLRTRRNAHRPLSIAQRVPAPRPAPLPTPSPVGPPGIQSPSSQPPPPPAPARPPGIRSPPPQPPAVSLPVALPAHPPPAGEPAPEPEPPSPPP